MKDAENLYNMIGLAYKGGNLVAGYEMCKKAILKNRANLIILAADCSYNTKKLFKDKCSYRYIPVVTFGTKQRLGEAIGKTDRTVLAVLNEGFSRVIRKQIGL